MNSVIGIGKQKIPWIMAGVRAALGPALIVGAYRHWNHFILAMMVAIALVLDIFDGVLARRWSCDTAAVRLFDSMSDTVFYICTAAAIWIVQPQMWQEYGSLIIILLALEAIRFIIDFAKFGRPAAYHSYLSKFWSLVLALAITSVFALDRMTPLITAALALGIICDVEGLAMSLMLPIWSKDIKTLWAAWHLRKHLMANRRKLVSSR